MIECQICKKECKNYRSLTHHVIQGHKLKTKEYYDNYLKKDNEDICAMYRQVKFCKKYTKFSNLRIGYSKYCSGKCVMLDPKIADKRKTHYFQKTGYTNPSQNPIVQRKKENTYFQKTGYKYTFQNPKDQEKAKNTYFQKTGYKNPGQNPEVQRKKMINYRLKTGYLHPGQNPEIHVKAKKTYCKKTGYLHPGQNPEVQRKKENAYFQKTGYKYTFQNPKVQKKAKNTYFQKTGYLHPGQNPEVQKKAKNTYFQKTGYENPGQNPEVQEKAKNTYYQKTGFLHPTQNPEVHNKMLNTFYSHFIPEMRKILDEKEVKLVDSKYMDAHCKHTWKCLKCNYIFKTCWNAIQQRYRCPKCYPRSQGQSQGEIGLGDWLQSIGFNIIQKDKYIVGKEIDIYIPELKIGIEYDGLWFHSKNAQDRYLPHCKKDPKVKQLIKTELCAEKDIQLIHIFEDEWIYHQDQIKKLLRKILFKNYDLLDNDCDMIILNRRFSKNPIYYEKLGYEVKVIDPKLYPNNGNFTIWDVGYLQLSKI